MRSVQRFGENKSSPALATEAARGGAPYLTWGTQGRATGRTSGATQFFLRHEALELPAGECSRQVSAVSA
jgi:hypothetical protein